MQFQDLSFTVRRVSRTLLLNEDHGKGVEVIVSQISMRQNAVDEEIDRPLALLL